MLRSRLATGRLLRCLSTSNGPDKLTAVIIGPPGAGKGTISKRLVNEFQVTHLSSGDMLRTHMSHETDIGLQARHFLEQGQLVPDEIMLQLIMGEIDEASETGWLLDGFPRTWSQVKTLVEETVIHTVINLNVPFQTIIDRIKGRRIHLPSGRVYNDDYNPPKIPGRDDVTGEKLHQRADDHPDTVLERLKQYEKETKPVIDFFHKKGMAKTFTGTESDVLWPQVKEHIEKDILKSKKPESN